MSSAEARGLSKWRSKQNQLRANHSTNEERYSDVAKRLHRIYTKRATGKHQLNRMTKFYSLETSSFWPHLLKTAAIVLDNGYDPKEYLAAQFEFFQRCFKQIPLPSQLHTSNAVDRYMQYLGTQRVRQETVELQEAAKPKISSKQKKEYWKHRISLLSRPKGKSDREALIAHCATFPQHVLIEWDVWDECKKRWLSVNG